ncbi:MAG: molybdenum cofactor biosynthesis protein MoaE [Gammaproteobacteria bacterium]|nr:molybdenum cofactor biosynthesis protein MoaE [Gammaproteobacteria bacterium]
MNQIQVQTHPMDIHAIQDDLRAGNPAIGALVSFVGLMRDMNDGDSVAGMILEHYPGMTEKAIQAIVQEAEQRWDLLGIRVVHRVGRLEPLDPIVVVAVASAHRGEAFRACEFLIDYLKTKAPFWKRESTHRGDRWVDARQSDNDAEARWKYRDD